MYWKQQNCGNKEPFRFRDNLFFQEKDVGTNEGGRILNDDEFMLALQIRDDIFKADKEMHLLVTQGSAFLLAIMAGMYLGSRTPTIEAASDFFERIPSERMAVLRNDRNSLKDVETAAVMHHDFRVKFVSSVVPVDHSQKNLKTNTTHQDPSTVRKKAVIGTSVKSDDSDTDPGFQLSVVPANDSMHSLLEAAPAVVASDRDPGSNTPLTIFLQTLKQNPRDADALAGVGDHYFHTGLHDSAKQYYYRAIAENPENQSVWNNLGSTHYYHMSMANSPHFLKRMGIPDAAQYKKSLYDSATASYTRAFSLDSSFVEALNNRAVIHDIYGNHDQALLDYTLAIRIDSTSADSYRKRAGMRKRSGEYKKAIDDYTAAIQLDSSYYRFNASLNYANAYFGRGTTYYHMGRYRKAIDDFDSALVINPRHSLAILNKGISLNQLKRYEEAIAMISMAVEQISPLEYDGAQMTGFMHRGNAYKALGIYEHAIVDYERAGSLTRLAARASWRIAQCHSIKQDYNTAIFWLKKSISHGFSDFKVWQQDRDLAPLWNMSEFLGLSGDMVKNKKR